MGKFSKTYGHLGDYSEQHVLVRHRLMTLNCNCVDGQDNPQQLEEYLGVGGA